MTPTDDRAALTDLVLRLSRWLDTGDTSGAADIYHPDAVVHSPRGTAIGLAEIVAYVERTTDAAEHTQHLTTDVLIDLDGDRAEVSTNGVVAFFPAGVALPAVLRLVGLRSAFQAVRTPAGWRFLTADIGPLWHLPHPRL